MIDFSVIIPVLNEAFHLRSCLDALQRQRIGRERFEIIVVDNGSTDGTLDVVRGYPDVVLLHEPKADPYLARNRGIAAARGIVLAFTDGDCCADENWLVALERAFDDGADIAVGCLAHPRGRGFWLDRYVDYYETKTRWVFEGPHDELIYAHAGNMAARAEIFEMIGPFSALPTPGDTELLYRLRHHMNTSTIRYVDDAVVTHLEIEHIHDVLPKLSCYGCYAAAVDREYCYRVLSMAERLKVAIHCARDYHYGPVRFLGLFLALALGLASFEWGRYSSSSSGSWPPA